MIWSDALKEKVDKELRPWGPKASAKEWAEIVAQYATEDELTAQDPYEVAQMVVRMRQRRAAIDDPESVPDVGSGLHVWAKSLMAAVEAGQDQAVTQFRRDVLDDKLLLQNEVFAWIKEQQEMDGDATTYVTVAAPDGWQEGDSLDAGTPLRMSRELLEVTATGEELMKVPTTLGGVLDRLRRLSESLVRRYPWHPAQASAFVLTGTTPIVSMLTVTTTEGSRTRVTLSVDPDTTELTLNEQYSRARKRLLGSGSPRAVREKGSRLVIHAAEHHEVDELGLLRLWNNAYPDWRYRDLRPFRQALHDAQRRVAGRPRPPRSG